MYWNIMIYDMRVLKNNYSIQFNEVRKSKNIKI